MTLLIFFAVLSIFGLIIFLNYYLKSISPKIYYINNSDAPLCNVTFTTITLNTVNKPNYIRALGEAFYLWKKSRSMYYWLGIYLSSYYKANITIFAKCLGVASHFAFMHMFASKQLFIHERVTSQANQIHQVYDYALKRGDIDSSYSEKDFILLYMTEVSKYVTDKYMPLYQFINTHAKEYSYMIGQEILNYPKR